MSTFDADRSKFLGIVIDEMLTAHEEYMESDSESFSPDDQLWQRIEDVIAVFSDGSLPGDMRRAASIVEHELQKQWVKFIDNRETSNDPIHYLPDNGLWSAIKSLRMDRQQAAAQAVLRRPEPVDELVKQNVPFRQIALIWGWLLKDGSPDLDRVREEIKTPGIHTSKWVDPRLAKIAADQERQQKVIDRLSGREAVKTARATAKPPETIGQLIEQGLSADQISRMHHCTIADVFAEADRLGLPRPTERYVGVQHSRTKFEHQVTPEQEAAIRRTTSGQSTQRAAESSNATVTTASSAVSQSPKRRPGRPKKYDPVEVAETIEHANPARSSDSEWDSDDAETVAPHSTDPTTDKVFNLYSSGKTTDEIASELGISDEQVNAVLENTTDAESVSS